MKKIRDLMFLAAALTVLFLAAGCSSDDDDDTPATSVYLSAGSWGTAGDGTITDLTTNQLYIVMAGGKLYPVLADGTLGTEDSKFANLIGTAITGLTNGTTYNVYKNVYASNGGTKELDADEFNTLVSIGSPSNGDSFTIKAGLTAPAAKLVIVAMEDNGLAAATGEVIGSQKLNGTTFDYTFDNTVADGARFRKITAGDIYFTIDLNDLTGTTFTTTILVSTHY
jgi:hypothetical protein